MATIYISSRFSRSKQRRQKWTNEQCVTLDAMSSVRGPKGSDQWVFHWLALGLLINRHVPSFVDDDTVSEHLHHVWDTQRNDLPFATDLIGD